MKTKGKTNVVTTSAPAARGTKISKPKNPRISYQNDGSCTVQHMEYVADLACSSSGQLTTRSFTVNPQNNESFTWLSAIATRFEMYRFKKLKFEFRTSTSTTRNGWVAMGMDFDAYDEAPSKSSILAWKYSSKAAAWENFAIDVSPDSRLSTFRYNNFTSSGDLRLDLLGKLWVLVDVDTGTSIGELFVSYEVEFRQPAYKLPPSLSAKITGSSAAQGLALPTNSTIKGNAAITIPTTNVLSFGDVGQFLISYRDILGGGATGAPTFTFTGETYSEFTPVVKDNIANGTSTAHIHEFLLDVGVPPVFMDVAGTASGSSVVPPEILISTFARAFN